MKMYQAITEALVGEGVDTIFTLVDDPILALVQEIAERGIRIVSTRHEQSAVGMADGYARIAGRPGVCVIGAGPALAQTGTALLTARRNRTPLLVLAGDMPDSLRHHVKNFDQEAFILATAGTAFMVRDESSAADMFAAAWHHAGSGAGPAVLNLRSDLLDGAISSPWSPLRRPLSPSAADGPGLDRIAAMITAARRPIVLVGGGALACGRNAILELAERSGALLATTIRTREWFRGHARDLGLMGSFSTAEARAVFGQADFMLAIGTSLNAYILGTAYGPGPLLPADAAVAQIDIDDSRIGEFWPIEQAVIGQADACVAVLLQRIGPATRTAWTRLAQEPAGGDANVSAAAPLTANMVLAALDRIMPDDRMVAVDCGSFVFPLLDAIRCPAESFLWTMNFGSVGLAVSIGIGAAFARADRPCFVFVGDGGFTMAPQEVMTAVTHGIDLTIVILDDSGYGAEARILEERGKPADIALLANPDLAEMARAMGAEAISVRTHHDLVGLAAQLTLPRERPLVIHAIIQRGTAHNAVPAQDTGVRALMEKRSA